MRFLSSKAYLLGWLSKTICESAFIVAIPTTQMTREQEMEMLIQQLEQLDSQLKEVKKRLEELK